MAFFDRFAYGASGAGGRFGLGLALVQHVARAHQGAVEVTGAPGRGATFTLLLPPSGAVWLPGTPARVRKNFARNAGHCGAAE